MSSEPWLASGAMPGMSADPWAGLEVPLEFVSDWVLCPDEVGLDVITTTATSALATISPTVEITAVRAPILRVLVTCFTIGSEPHGSFGYSMKVP